MRTLVRDILPQIAQNVGDSGVGLCTPEATAEAIENLSYAVRILQRRCDDDGTLTYWTVPSCGGCFAIPQECLEGRQFFVNGFSASTYDQWYSGTVCGGLRAGTPCCYGPSIIDVGTFPIPHPFARIKDVRMSLVALSDADAGKTVELEITNIYGDPVRETLTLLPNQQPVKTENFVQDITFFQKPQTEGIVRAEQYFSNNQRLYLCDYEPLTIIGAFRRKRMPSGLCSGCNMVTIKGKRRFIPLTSEYDICPFDDPIALGFALRAVAAWRRGASGDSLAEYNSNLLQAVNEIYKQMRDEDSAGNVSRVKFRSGFGCNPSQAANRPLPGTSWYGRGRGIGAGGVW